MLFSLIAEKNTLEHFSCYLTKS